MHPLDMRASTIALLFVLTACGDDTEAPDASVPRDAGSRRDGARDDGAIDAGAADAAPEEPECDDVNPCGAGESCTGGVCVSDPELAASVTQYGITWTFDRPMPVGRFVTGDWWVVGPVQVVSVDPMPTDRRNGSMIDPVGQQAYDARGGEHDGSKAVMFPVSIDGGHSMVSSISHPDTPGCMQGGADGWMTYDGDCQRGPIDTQAVLTVLAEAPPADAFRPAYSRHGTLHRASDLCMARLPSFAATELPDAADMLRHVQRPWIDHLNSWTMQHGCATSNMYCYGREIGNIVSAVSVFVLHDTPERDEVVNHLVQIGIDNWGVLQAGGGWGGDGGHFNGRKWPIVFAGGLLGDAEMSSPGTNVGNEDRMTYFGEDGTALWGRDCSSCYFEAGCDYAGGCSSGAKDCRDPAGESDGCDDYRNCCTSPTWIGEALAARVMGLEEAWGHPAFFAYVDRWMAGDVAGGGDTSDFVAAAWAAHADAPPASCP